MLGKKTLFRFLLLSAAITASASAASYSINGIFSQTDGGNTNIVGSGDKSNTATWTPGVVASYRISDGTTNYGLRVSVTNPTGVLVAGTDSLMVARTTNSQGLLDPGTLSIYFNPNIRGEAWSADIRFSFFNLDQSSNFTTPYSPGLLLTSLDIDSNQRYYTDNADFSQNITYAGSNLSAPAEVVAGYTGFSTGVDGSFNDTKLAVSSVGVTGATEFDMRVAHNDVALFIFEFRDPSQVVPEPSSLLLSFLGGALLLRRRR